MSPSSELYNLLKKSLQHNSLNIKYSKFLTGQETYKIGVFFVCLKTLGKFHAPSKPKLGLDGA
jgi:hypothetical protein